MLQILPNEQVDRFPDLPGQERQALAWIPCSI